MTTYNFVFGPKFVCFDPEQIAFDAHLYTTVVNHKIIKIPNKFVLNRSNFLTDALKITFCNIFH